MSSTFRPAFNCGQYTSRVTLLTASLAAAAILLGPATASAWVYGNNHSYTSPQSMSADGRYVAFLSDASNLVPNDTNGQTDIFRLDTQNGTVVRVSLNSSGNQATGGPSHSPAINSDGTKIAFLSSATNLVSGDTNGVFDVFVRDLTAGTTVRVSVTSSGDQSTGGRSYSPSISGDGTKVAFSTFATNLVPGDTNNLQDIYVRDLSAGTTVRASVDSSGNPATGGGSYSPSISSDGTKVAFDSGATNLVSGDTNTVQDIFVRDLSANTTVRANVDSSGNQAIYTSVSSGSFSPSINSDGTKVAFYSGAANLIPDDTNGMYDVFVHDLSAGTTLRASVSSAGTQATDSSFALSISGDGTKVAFQSRAKNLVTGDTNNAWDVFVRDLSAGTTVRASVDSAGNQANNYNDYPAISADGTRVAFSSVATNLLPGDTGSFWDVYVHDLTTGSTTVPVTLSGFEVE